MELLTGLKRWMRSAARGMDCVACLTVALSCAGCRDSDRSAAVLTAPIAEDMIAERLYVPPGGVETLRRSLTSTIVDRERFIEVGAAENLTAALISMGKRGVDLDITISGFRPSAGGRILQENVSSSGTTLVRRQDISDVRILRQDNKAALGCFAWEVRGTGFSGRGLFAAERRGAKWELSYLGVARKGSTNPTHGYAAFPLYADPCRHPEVRLPVALSGCGSSDDKRFPAGNWRMINLLENGVVWIHKKGHLDGRCPVSDDDLSEVIRTYSTEPDSCLILYCDGRVAWRRAEKIMLATAHAGDPVVWFCVEPAGHTWSEAFLDVDMTPIKPGEAAQEHWMIVSGLRPGQTRLLLPALENIMVPCAEVPPPLAPPEPQPPAAEPASPPDLVPGGCPEIKFDGQTVNTWRDLETVLQSLRRAPGSEKHMIILKAAPDARLGFVITAWDIARRAGFGAIRWAAPPSAVKDEILPAPPPDVTPEGKGDPLDVPIEDIPIEPPANGKPKLPSKK